MSNFKVVNLDRNTSVFFTNKTDSVFVSPLMQVRRYVERNKNKFLMAVYIETTRPKPFPRWVPFTI